MKKFLLLLFAVCFFAGCLLAQDPERFEKEVSKLEQQSFDSTRQVILFTGSSSIRGWKNLQQYFPEKNIVNNGFGGSHMSDLIHYYESLILPFQPAQVFIYEGDNDIASGKAAKDVLKETRTLIKKIKKDLPGTEIVLISAKPSLARWKLKEEYGELNELYRRLALKMEHVKYVNIWDVMLDASGEPRKDIFLEDGLHMNKQGYDLWAEKIRNYLLR